MQGVRKKRGRPPLTRSSTKRSRVEYFRRKVLIGDQFERWNYLRSQMDVTHPQFAKILLDSFKPGSPTEEDSSSEENVPNEPSTSSVSVRDLPLHQVPSSSSHEFRLPPAVQLQQPSVSTPVSKTGTVKPHFSGSELSGIEAMVTSESSNAEEDNGERKRTYRPLVQSSFINPFELTIDVSENIDSDDDPDDDTYAVSCDITLKPTNMESAQDLPVGDVEFGAEEETDDEEDAEGSDNLNTSSGVRHVTRPEEASIVSSGRNYIVDFEQLITLAGTSVNSSCDRCNAGVQVTRKEVGTALYLIWKCQNNHDIHRWCSQPVLNRGFHALDLVISSSILLSGNNFAKIALLAKCSNLNFLSSTSYYRIQHFYLVPSVEQYWSRHIAAVRREMQGKDLVILGDGRNDSPGHCAQYCTYTMMDDGTKKIVAVETLDKREVGKKSTNMEKEAFRRCLHILEEEGLNVVEVVTDAHPQISALMKTDAHKDKKHSHDIWHASKGVGKKVVLAGQERPCRKLLSWTRDITNHFWAVAQHSSSEDEFIGNWVSTLHHVTNEHEWTLPLTSASTFKCLHGSESPEGADPEKWLEKGSPAHDALRKVVMNPTLLKKASYYINNRTTDVLENFNQLILMYCGKRFAYTPPVYRARNLLAALDHNEHISRPVLEDEAGNAREHVVFNKKSGRWSSYPMKAAKNYNHIKELMELIVKNRLQDGSGMHRIHELGANDPRLLSENIAPVERPPTAEIIAAKKSRLSEII